MDRKELEDHMRLNPGPKRRVAASTCKFCLWLFVAVGALFTFLVGIFVVGILYQLIHLTVHPHSELYHDVSSTLEAPSTDVIKPLVDSNTTFDIVATVWVRANADEERKFNNEWAEVETLLEGDSARDQKEYTHSEYDSVLSSDVKHMLEYPVFSETIFRGLHLRDKHISTVVNFTFPTRRFRDLDITNHDLRASFVLVPSESSPLRYLTNFSSWVPREISYWPSRPWPLPDAPPGSAISSSHLGSRSLADQAIDAFGTSIPLLEILEVGSNCIPASKNGENSAFNGTGTPHQDENEDVEWRDSLVDMAEANLGPMFHMFTPESAHKKHPHVITRTQLRVVIEEHTFNLTAYNEAHGKLKAEACGMGDTPPPLKPSRNRCVRPYKTHGHVDTRLELSIPVADRKGDSGDNVSKNRTEWMYAPYMNELKHAAGPLDLLPIPVTRENCTAQNMVVDKTLEGGVPWKEDADTMNITWHISFSGRSPGQMFLADMVVFPLRPGYNASRAQKAMSHSHAELTNGLMGHRYYDDDHPRVRLSIMTVAAMASWISPLFNIHYWYTRSSTVGISIRAQALRIMVVTFEDLLRAGVAMASAPEPFSSLTLTTVVFILGFTYLPTLAIIRAIARLDVGFIGWIPYVKQAKATRRERASDRVDGRTTMTSLTVLFAALLVLYYVARPHSRIMLAGPVGSEAATADATGQFLMTFVQHGYFALLRLPDIMQLIMNARSGTFAGQSRIAVLLKLLESSANYASHTPFFGRWSVPATIPWDNAVRDVLVLTYAWQALRLSVVDQSSEDEAEK